MVEYENSHENSLLDEYRLGDKLGRGAFGQVREANHLNTGDPCAVKIIDVRSRRATKSGWKGAVTVNPRLLDYARHEAKIMRCVGAHKHCVQLYDAFMDSVNSHGVVYLVMEKCGCSMLDGLGKLSVASEADVARIFREMLLGIMHVHGVGIVHRDVKPDNFLFGGEDGTTVKLIDFGLSAQLPSSGCLTGCYGTAPYMSPEMAADMPYAKATDMWSFGATAYVLLYSDIPYLPTRYLTKDHQVDSKAIRNAIVLGEPAPSYKPPARANIPLASDRAQLFVRTMLERSPDLRCTAEEALQLALVKQTDSHVGTDEVTDANLAPALRLARHKAHGFRTSVDPAVARDNLVQILRSMDSMSVTLAMTEEVSVPPMPVHTCKPSGVLMQCGALGPSDIMKRPPSFDDNSQSTCPPGDCLSEAVSTTRSECGSIGTL